MNFELAFPTLEDAKVVLAWRNDPLTRQMSFTHLNVRSLEEFFTDYIQNYFSLPSLPPLFAIQDGEKVGILRFDPANSAGFCEISLLVAPEKRNRGLGQEMLKLIDPFLIRQGILGVIAQVKKENQSSLRAFHKAGFQVTEAIFTISSKDSAERGKSRLQRSGPNEERMAKAMRDEEDRSGEAAAGQIPDEIVKIAAKEGEVVRLEKQLKPQSKEKVFIIAEAGSNWHSEGDREGVRRGFQLIEKAKEAGADAVKFQTFKAAATYVSNAGVADYLQEDIEKLFAALEMSEEMLALLVEQCKKVGIEFMSSVFSPRDFALIDPHVARHKIASYEISYEQLIALAAESKKPLILSTGASRVQDIDWAVATFRKNGGKDLTLLQCTAKYPADPKSMNLKVIPWLESRYQVKAGLSDHSLHPFQAPLAAVALGARAIEKHFTLDRTLKGPDHPFAIEPHELKELVTSIREVEEMKGTGYKDLQPSEEELYFFCRRGIQALRDIQPGEILKLNTNIAVLRPGKRSLGLHPKFLSQIEGKQIKQAIGRGEGLQLNYLEQT